MSEKGHSNKRVNPNGRSVGSSEEKHSAGSSKKIGSGTEGKEGETSTSSLSLQGTSHGSQFDVFLSFRGEDTRKGFTGHLYQGLELRGISTFIDNENLEKGEKIDRLLDYIEKSKICIPIISKGYADSKWCLKELTTVVESDKEIIPVFFDVDPSDVKKQAGPFASGFIEHESKEEQEMVRKWREALRKVGNTAGYTLKDTDGDEAKLVQTIVKRILDEVNPYHPHVGEYVIGHEDHLKKLMGTLDMESNNVRIIGIYGMGGIGKTTLAKAVYNEICSKFEACSFIFDVREAAKQFKGLESLQQQLLKGIVKYDKPIADKSIGIDLIKKRIGVKKVLIILDDVDSEEQLEALVGSRAWFEEGSRIIITTRNKRPLVALGVEENEIYEHTRLNESDSMKLFCHHAFRSEKPPRGVYAKLCDEAVSSIGVLPLALKVLGSLFFKQTEERRRDLLAESKKSQHHEIFDKLKISYNSLTYYEQQVFLDIACFFIGKRSNKNYIDEWRDEWWEVDDVKLFWKECGFRCPGDAIDVLKHKALIKINERHRYPGEQFDPDRNVIVRHFEMHDQIRDMGRKIVEDTLQEKKSVSRLWGRDPKVIMRVLQKRKVQQSIEGILLRIEEGEPFSASSIQELEDLRLFHVDGAKFKGSVDFPMNLKWLGLPNCQFNGSVSIPDSIAVLDLSRSDYMANVLVNKCRSKSMVLDRLKILDLSWTSIAKTPDFSNIPCLETLTLKGCTTLVEVHESVGQLKSLVWLNLAGCKKLKKLLDTLCNLISLKLLCLDNCKDLCGLPEEFGRLTSLKYIDLYHTPNITTLPTSIRQLHAVEHLLAETTCKGMIHLNSNNLVCASWVEASSLEFIGTLPVPCFSKKTHLFVINDEVEELPNSIAMWKNLKSLILDCKSLKALPDGLGQLQKLKTLEVYSDKLISSDDTIPLETLEKLVLQCVTFKHVPSFNGKAENLKHLTLDCKNMEVLPDWIGSLSRIETLVIKSSMLERLLFKLLEAGSLRSSNPKGSSWCGELVDHLGWLTRELCLDKTGNRSLPPLMGKLTKLGCLSLLYHNYSLQVTSTGFLCGSTSTSRNFKGTLCRLYSDGCEAKVMIVKRINLDQVNPRPPGDVNPLHLHHPMDPRSRPLWVPDYPVGLYAHIGMVMRALNLMSNDVRVIGIHGMGGVGKTTLAKAIYNNIYSEFEACSFISNVRQCWELHGGLEALQEQLHRDIFKYEERFITGKTKGIQLMKDKIRTMKVLIILDDVDSTDQLLALVGNRDWFGEGSRIIITTRDTKPLLDLGVKEDEIYELKGLSHDESMKLLCYHPFRTEKPPNEAYAELYDEAVSIAQGLPLALQIYGSLLFDLNPEELREMLELLKARQDREIFERLKSSFDRLNEDEKQLLLDIACFFGGDKWEVDDAKWYWKECGFHPEAAISGLMHKALIKINENINGWAKSRLILK